MADLKFEIDTSQFNKAFKLWRQISSSKIKDAVQKQAHNLSLDLWRKFVEVAPSKTDIYNVPEDQNYKVALKRTSKAGAMVKSRQEFIGKRERMNRAKQLKGFRKFVGGSWRMTNLRHIAIREEIIKRANAVKAAAAGWLAFYNRHLRDGDKLVPRNKPYTNAAIVQGSGKSFEVIIINKVKGIDKVNRLKGNLVQAAVNERTRELLDHISQKLTASFEAFKS